MSRVLLVFALAACSRERTMPPDCEAKAADLGRFLSVMDHGVNTTTTFDVALVSRDDLALRVDQVPVKSIIVTATDVRFHRQRATDRDTLAGLVKADIPTHDPHAIWLIVDRRARWDEVVMALGAAQDAGRTSVTFVFTRSPSVVAPVRRSIDDDLDKLESSKTIGDYGRKLFDRCVQAADLFAQIGRGNHADPIGWILPQIAPKVVECKCGVDPADVKTFMWRLVGNAHPAAYLHVDLADTGAPVALAADVPWDEASKHLTATMTTLHATVTP